MKLLYFIDVSNPIWYQERSYLKSSSITPSALLLLMISAIENLWLSKFYFYLNYFLSFIVWYSV